MINTTKIVLIVGLVYIAFQIKKQSTRNLILIITGLLAFCMFKKEGFSDPVEGLNGVEKGTITVTGADRTFTPTPTTGPAGLDWKITVTGEAGGAGGTGGEEGNIYYITAGGLTDLQTKSSSTGPRPQYDLVRCVHQM